MSTLHQLKMLEDGRKTCTVCGGIDAELPQDCPGRQLTEEEKEAIARQDLDYKDGRWRHYMPL